MTHPFDTDNDRTIIQNPCCCCGKFDIAVAIVNCNGITDDNFDLYFNDTLAVSLTEPLPGTPEDPCTEDSLRNRGHWLTPPSYTGPHPDSSNLWCGAETTDGVLWDDHTITAFHDIGDHCVYRFGLVTTNNNGCANFGHIYFYRVIHGNADATPPTLDSLCLIQTTNYQPASYDAPGSPTSGTYYCVYGSGRLGNGCTNIFTADPSGYDTWGGPYTDDVACHDAGCGQELYYLVRCDNGDCCEGYWCLGGGQCYGPHTHAEAVEEADGETIGGPYIDSDDCLHRGGCYPFWCVQGTSTAFCVQAATSDIATSEGFYTLNGGPYGSLSACNAVCVFACPCCPDFTPSPLLAVMQVPGVVVANQISLTYANCQWTGSTIQFGNHLNLTVSFTSDCHLHWLMTTDPFFGPSQTYTDTDTGAFPCSIDGSYTAQGGTNKYNGTYSQLVLTLPPPMAMAQEGTQDAPGPIQAAVGPVAPQTHQGANHRPARPLQKRTPCPCKKARPTDSSKP